MENHKPMNIIEQIVAETTKEEVEAASQKLIRKDTVEKRLINDNFEATEKFGRYDKAKKERKEADNFDYGDIETQEIARKLQRQREIEILRRDNPLTHFHPAMAATLPLVKTELTLVGGITNTGKTTLIVFWAFQAIKNGHRVMIISNEQSGAIFLQKIAALFLDYDISRKSEFQDCQREELDRKALELVESGRLKVIDNNTRTSKGGKAHPSTVQGLKRLFEAIICKRDVDLVFLDHISKITDDSGINFSEESVIRGFCNYLQEIQERLPCHVFVFAQLWEPGQSHGYTFTQRLKFCKSMKEKFDYAYEMAVRLKDFVTTLVVEKQRDSKARVGDEFDFIFDHGHYHYADEATQKSYGYAFLTEKVGKSEVTLLKKLEVKDESDS